MKILAIETSCDETSVSVVEGLSKDKPVNVLSLVTATSLALHAETGGIIPERAARKQLEFMMPTLTSALKKAFPNSSENPKDLMSQIDCIAVTVGPGLIGSLLVGVETAKTLAITFNKPIVPVNHVKAHIYSCFINGDNEEIPDFPILALVVSGGHTDFVLMKNHNDFQWLGGTRDDAAGECFDKCARLLGLPYPGGPAISKMAEVYRKKHPEISLKLFPRPMIHEDNFDVSFSGLKTAVLRVTNENKKKGLYSNEQLCAEVEESISAVLSDKFAHAAMKVNAKSAIICGGVSANARVKKLIISSLHLNEVSNIKTYFPELKYTTDNAAMIGAFSYYNYDPINWSEISPNPELHF